MLSGPDPDALLADLRAAIEGVLGRHGEILTKWVFVAESLGSDGERGLWTMVAEGQKAWDTLGLLEFGNISEAASVMAQKLRED